MVRVLDKFKVAAIQFETKPDDKEENLLKAKKLIDEAGKEGVRLSVFSEYCWTGYPDARFAESIPGGSIIEGLADVAEKHDMYIVTGNIIEKEDEALYSTNAVIGPKGEVMGKQRKVHLLNESLGGLIKNELGAGLKRGESFEVFQTELGKIGVLTGSDLDPPEAARTLAVKGSDIIAISVAGEIKWLDIARFLAQARAYENGVYVILSNRVGKWEGSPMGDIMYRGGSMVISPMGEVLGDAGAYSQGMAIASVDILGLHEMRKSFNILKLRYVKAYSI